MAQSGLEVVTLGMFIIDNIYYPIPRAPVTNIIGGAGSYTVLGARIMRGSGNTIGWTVHIGSDFPEKILKEIQLWDTRCNFIHTPERLTTRGLNIYRQNERRDFEYATPKLRIDQTTLTTEQLGAKVFHLICSPLRCMDLVKGIIERRGQMVEEGILPVQAMDRPMFVWEPVPDLCIPSELANCVKAIQHVDVMSPNIEELQSLIGTRRLIHTSGVPNMQELDSECHELLDSGSSGRPQAVIVRLGELGARVVTSDQETSISAYHRPYRDMNTTAEKATWKNRVVDPTGAGNAFLGGCAIGLLAGEPSMNMTNFERAAVYGSVAASFAVEQIGMPELTPETGLAGEKEQWNGEYVGDRLRSYLSVS